MSDQSDFTFGIFDPLEMTELLKEAERDPLLEGFVYPLDATKKRLPIFCEDALVGFATPRQDKDSVWRMGAIYVKPSYRGKGLARDAILTFMKGRYGRAFIEDDNIPSQKAYSAAGFRIVRSDPQNKGCWWENF